MAGLLCRKNGAGDRKNPSVRKVEGLETGMQAAGRGMLAIA
jgi:hypothetical protein